MTQENLMWLVGFWEGEGTAGCWKAGKQSKRLLVSISQKYPDIIKRIQNLVGYGHVSKVCKQGINKGTMYRWTCGDKQARNFIRMVYPLVKSGYKKGQLRKALKLDSELVNPNFHTPAAEKEEIQRYLLQRVPIRYILYHFARNRTTLYDYKKELGL